MAGHINASISQKDGGMVSFLDDDDDGACGFNDNETIAVMDAAIQRTVALADRLSEMDRDVSTSSQYLAKVTRAERVVQKGLKDSLAAGGGGSSHDGVGGGGPGGMSTEEVLAQSMEFGADKPPGFQYGRG